MSEALMNERDSSFKIDVNHGIYGLLKTKENAAKVMNIFM